MKLITSLSAAIIPHSLWASRKWYGIIVTDSSSGAPLQFQNSDYTLAWPSFNAFLDQSLWNQRTGYLQLWIPSNKISFCSKIENALHNTHDCGIEFGTSKRPSGPNCIDLQVVTSCELDQRKAWKCIESALNMELARF